MSDAGLLNLVLFLPLIGIGILLLTPAGSHDTTRRVTLVVMIVQLALTAWLYTASTPASPACSSRPACPGSRPGA